MDFKENNLPDSENSFLLEFYKYLSFWPYFLLSVLLSILFAFLYLRYTPNLYQTTAKIEILDKAQDSDMSLPTSMTIFNRSMINLENEIGVLSSNSINTKVVKKLNSNIFYYSTGYIKKSQLHKSEWDDNYNLEFKIDTDTIKSTFEYLIFIQDDKLFINKANTDGEVIQSYNFKSLSTFEKNHDLPFNISIPTTARRDFNKSILIRPVREVVYDFIINTNIYPVGTDSDQLMISLNHQNKKIAQEYINFLISEFDKDGVIDRQLEHKRTMEFADNRSEFLTLELQQIENRRQSFKEKNKLTDIISDAKINVTKQFEYNSELFSAKAQLELLELFELSVKNNEFKLLPVNIGLDNTTINELILQYNTLIKDRDKFILNGAGPNNVYIISLDKQLDDFYLNLISSVNNYRKSLDLTIKNLKEKEDEFSSVYESIPENEKILRSIERELEVKEALFLLLLQKREEAAINFAVVKPSIKIIDNAISNNLPISPKVLFTYVFSIVLGFLIPVIFLFIWFLLDTKIHTKEHITRNIKGTSVLCEIPYVKDNLKFSLYEPETRNPFVESVRMIIANLNFVLFDKSKSNKTNIILVTSSIKGEGKTMVSSNLASILSSKSDKKVILIGADLRNPQIHKLINADKERPGLSNYIYKTDTDWKEMILKVNNLDIMLSGTIPPNPTELLSSNRFSSFIEEVSSIYDYVIIDSAPCLLVSDTFEISKYVDSTVFVIRANHTDIKLCNFINECIESNKLPKLNIVLNGVGNSQSYGYKYGYQYGYQYGYKYSYNYGYGYGYGSDDKK